MALDISHPRTRRALLTGTLNALGGALAAALAGPLPVEAATDHVMYVNNENGAPVLVAISEHQAGYASSGAGTAVHGSSDSGHGVQASSSTGIGLNAFCGIGPAVVGASGSSDLPRSKTGVQGYANQDGASVGVLGKSPTGNGVVGFSANPAASGVWGDNTGGGFGVAGSTGGGPGKAAVWGDNHGSTGGVGVRGSSREGTAVYGYSGHLSVPLAPAHIGVYGRSDDGRGGVFSGTVAQLRLVPSTATTHPTAGAVGDLFVDASGRLWFCTATGSPAVWKRVQLV